MSITSTPSIAATLPHEPMTSVRAVAEHARSELSNDLDRMVASISVWDQQFAVLAPGPDGSLTFLSAYSLDEAREYYADKVATTEFLAGEQRHLELHGAWYEFIETKAAVRQLDSDARRQFTGAFLFPTWTDGIVGELCWVVEGWDTEYLDLTQLEALTARLNAYDDAWHAGDPNARLATFEDTFCSASRVKSVDGTHAHRALARTRDELRAAWGAPEAGRIVDFERIHHVVATTAVFAAYRMVLEVPRGQVVRETVQLLPYGPNLRFAGELSYSLETEVSV